MHNLYYIAETDFTKGSAVTNRIINNIKAIVNSHDCKITVIGYGDIPEMNREGIPIKNVKKGKGAVQKLFYFALRGFFVKKLLQKERPAPGMVIFYGYSPRYLLPLFSYVKKRNIKIVSDIVEWYNPSHLPLGRFGPLALDLNIGMKYLIPKCDGVIAISTFLQNYYASKKLKTIRVPVLVDTVRADLHSVDIDRLDRRFLNLIYAGVPGKKDLIKNMIDAVEVLNNEGLKVQFHILGLSLFELTNIYKKQFSSAIICHGSIRQALVPEYLSQADFSVLLRPIERYSKAGFPTKFVESLNAGLPVIANLTSDLPVYLKDGYNGFIVNEPTVCSLIQVLRRAILLDKKELSVMKENARSTAINNFDYRLFSSDFSKFFSQIASPN